MQKESLIKSIAQDENYIEHHKRLQQPQAREPLPTIQTYCKSKTFIAGQGINPIVAAASALFSLMSKLSYLTHYDDIKQLKKGLIHEIKAFECAALNRGYSEEQIILTRYAICTSLDDIILATAWGKNSEWREDTLLYIFQGEMWGGERLFLLLDHLREHSEQHIEVLEFIYICLSLGFEGKYRIVEKDKDSFYEILDATYRLIRKHRGDLPTRLSKISTISKIPRAKNKNLFLKITLLTSAAVIASMFFLYSFIIEKLSQPLMNHLTTIEKRVQN